MILLCISSASTRTRFEKFVKVCAWVGEGGWRDYVCEDARANKPQNVEVWDLQITINI